MDRGDINEYKASIIAGPTMVLDDDKARAVDALMASRIEGKFPRGLHDDPDYKLLQAAFGQKRRITIAHLINRRYAHSTNSKDYEFSRTTVRQLWQDGLDDVRRSCAHPDWLKATEVESGVRVFDLSRPYDRIPA